MIIQYQGFVIGIAVFILIGLFHPVVIKSEYHFGTKVWPVFLLSGIGFCAASFFIQSFILSTISSITGIIFLWSIKELFEQRERVKKGWYPKKDSKK